ncbi:MAG: transglycosylase domain-containing protein [Flavobacteriaceae bacterium]
MKDPFETRKRGKWRRIGLLEIDSWIDTQMFRLWEGTKRAYEGYAAKLERLSFRGPKRLVFELTSDGMTFGLAGAVLALALALPAFDETRGDWLSNQQYSVTFLDRYGNVIGRRGILHNDGIELSDIPDHVIKAVLATEDRRFYEHFGIDIPGTFRAMVANMRANSVVQGGSSITQQLAKNLFLSNERTFERKIKEAFLSIWLESRLTKNQILKLYLDRAYLGGGTFGVAAASEFYFGKSIKEVTIAEAAMLAGLFKAPGNYAPHLDLPASRARANVVLNNLVEAGFMTEGQVYAARRNPASAVDRSEVSSPDFFLDWAFEEVKRLANGKDYVLEVKTSVDSSLQKAAEDSVEASLRQSGAQYHVKQAALVSMDPDGAVRAMVGGRDYGQSQFNRATNALRQPGSSFKPYVYMTALMNGFTEDSMIVDAPICIGNWCPSNYSHSYSGRMTLTTALTRSINTVPVRLSQSFGRDKIAETAERMGVATPIKVTRSMPLGASEVTVLDQATGYATLASGGYKAHPYGVLEIRNSEGKLIYSHKKDGPKPEQVLPAPKVAELNRMLNSVVNNGTGRRAQLEGIPVSGKTGTTNAYRDAWFIGFTGNYVTAVWFGNDDYASTARLTGGNLPAKTWQQFMAYAHTGIELKPIPGVGGVPEYVMPAPVASTLPAGAEPARPQTLSERSKEVLLDIHRMLEAAPPIRPDATRPERVSSVGADRVTPSSRRQVRFSAGRWE